ncbi:MAG: hypothetical protein CM15mP74_29540 [Halieaceae bacterium]|nr:MAG: hypothetical protein CM15mP74_29540 [Halieaceae bacterium]
MRAVYYETHGDAEVLQIGELDKPACGDEQVLVEVAAAGSTRLIDACAPANCRNTFNALSL